MTDEQKEIFKKFDDCRSEYSSLAEEAIFTYAFKLGARLVYELFASIANNINNIDESGW